MTPFADYLREQRIPRVRTGILLAELARQGLPVLVTARTYGRERHPLPDVLVSPDPSVPGRWRATRFDGDTPDGHEDAPSLYAGLVLAHRPGCVITQVTVETVPAQHPDDCGACDTESACEECATTWRKAPRRRGRMRRHENDRARGDHQARGRVGHGRHAGLTPGWTA